MNFLLHRRLPFVCFDDLVEFLTDSPISVLAVDHVMVGTWTDAFFESEQTREDARFAFVIKDTSDLDAARRLLDSTLDDFDNE